MEGGSKCEEKIYLIFHVSEHVDHFDAIKKHFPVFSYEGFPKAPVTDCYCEVPGHMVMTHS